jgi:hypothetical protein
MGNTYLPSLRNPFNPQGAIRQFLDSYRWEHIDISRPLASILQWPGTVAFVGLSSYYK